MVIKLCKTDGCLMAETREEVDSIVANLSEDQKNKIKYFYDKLKEIEEEAKKINESGFLPENFKIGLCCEGHLQFDYSDTKEFQEYLESDYGDVDYGSDGICRFSLNEIEDTTLFYDQLSGRYFYGQMQDIKGAIDKLTLCLPSNGKDWYENNDRAYLYNLFYTLVGLPKIEELALIDNHKIDSIDVNTALTEGLTKDNKPVTIVKIDFH